VREFKLNWEYDKGFLKLTTSGFMDPLYCEFSKGVLLDLKDPTKLDKALESGLQPIAKEVERTSEPKQSSDDGWITGDTGYSGIEMSGQICVGADFPVPSYATGHNEKGNILFESEEDGKKFESSFRDWRYVAIYSLLMDKIFNVSKEEYLRLYKLPRQSTLWIDDHETLIRNEQRRRRNKERKDLEKRKKVFSHVYSGVEYIHNVAYGDINGMLLNPYRQAVPDIETYTPRTLDDDFDKVLIHYYAGIKDKRKREEKLREWKSLPSSYMRFLIRMTSLSMFCLTNNDVVKTSHGTLEKVFDRLRSSTDPKKEFYLKIHGTPKTDLQKAMSMGRAEELFYDAEFLKVYLFSGSVGDSIKFLTSSVRKELVISDKFLSIEQSVTVDTENMIKSFNKGEDFFGHYSSVVSYLKDGAEFYDTSEPLSVDEGGYKEVKGSLVNQLRNAAYNHRVDAKKGLDKKLKEFMSRSIPMRREPPSGLAQMPQVVQDTLLLSKVKIIELGHEFGHCFGGRHSSENWLLNRGTVCAEIDCISGSVVECRDIRNKITVKSKGFRKDLKEAMAVIKLSGGLDSPTPKTTRGLSSRQNISVDGELLINDATSPTYYLNGDTNTVFTSPVQYADFGSFTMSMKEGNESIEESWRIAYVSEEPSKDLSDAELEELKRSDIFVSLGRDGKIGWRGEINLQRPDDAYAEALL